MATLTVEELGSQYNIKMTDTTVLQSLLDTAEQACLQYCGYQHGEVTEYFDGGTRSVALTYAPIKSIKAVEVAGTASLYRFDSRAHSIKFMEKVPAGNDVIRVDYECGWDGEAPAVVKSAIALTVQHLLKLTNGKLMGTLQRTTDAGSEQIEQSIPPIAVKALLDHYRANVM